MSGRKIVLPNDKGIREALRFKMEEYGGRLEKAKGDGYKDEELVFMQNTDSAYKFSIAKALLENGEVDTWELSRAFHEKYGSVDVESFNRAAAVIDDYCTTGGKN